MRKSVKSILTAVAVVCMVATGVSLSVAAILDNGKKEVKSVRSIPEGFLVQVSDGIYEYRPSLTTGNCVEEADYPCHYTVSETNNIPNTQSQWTKSEIDGYTGISNPSPETRLFVEEN